MRQGRKMTYTLPEHVLGLHLQNNASDNTYQQFLTSIPTLVSEKSPLIAMLVSQDTQSNISFNFINTSVSSRIVIYVLMLRKMEQPVTLCVI